MFDYKAVGKKVECAEHQERVLGGIQKGAGVLEDGRTSMDGERGTLKGTVGEARGTRSDVHM